MDYITEAQKKPEVYSNIVGLINQNDIETARVFFKNEFSLFENDSYEAINEVALYEARIGRWFSDTWRKVLSYKDKVLGSIKSLNPEAHMKKIEQDLEKNWVPKAEKIAKENGIKITDSDVRQLKARMISDFPHHALSGVPDKTLEQMKKSMRLKETRSTHMDDGTWNATYFVTSWLLASVLYYLLTSVGPSNVLWIPFFVILIKSFLKDFFTSKIVVS